MRIDYMTLGREPTNALLRIERHLRESGLDSKILTLVKLRVSYINGCAYCVDMHTKDARAEGESEQRLYAVPVFRETPFYTPRERAALSYAEALTKLPSAELHAGAVDELKSHFSEREIVDLTFAIVAINAWNRLSIALGAEVGSYVVGAHRSLRE
jgi:AhpD family alkylhydroperoxidase